MENGVDHATVAHYDAWPEEFEPKRRSEKPDLHTRSIFVGPEGYGFLHDAEHALVAKFHEFREIVY